jgi:tetratricopeptide (TPR) repeat protein
MCNAHCKTVDQALAAVRTGDLGNDESLETWWADRVRLGNCSLHVLRVHTMLWDAYQGLGKYHRAAERLRANDAVQRALDCLDEARKHPTEFAKNFSMARDKKWEYKMWRQRAMAVLAHGFSAFQLRERGAMELFGTVDSFLKRCLDPLGYESNGARARLHFFRGVMHESVYDMGKAIRSYDLSLHFCRQRAFRELARRQSPNYETERSFIVYCLGRMELRIGQLDFDSGRLTAAKRHASEAGLLLRASKDPYLPHMADLLWLKVSRYEEDFLKRGWELVGDFEDCAGQLAGNLPNHLEAKIEAVKTCVYLLHFGQLPRKEESTDRSLSQALKEIEGVIKDAGEKHPRLVFDALLVKARTLNRMGKFEVALRVVKEAEDSMSPIPGPLLAEALFVRGKIHATWTQPPQTAALIRVSRERALDYFLKAEGVGHASVTFKIACKLQIAELCLDLGYGSRAEGSISEAKELSRDVEHTFLNRRLEELLKRVEGKSFYRSFEKNFDLQGARDQLEKNFLLYVSRASGYAVREFPQHFKDLKEEYLAPGMNYDHLMTLLNRHFGVPRRSERQKPTSGAAV